LADNTPRGLRIAFGLLVAWLSQPAFLAADESALRVTVDVSQTPELKAWGDDAEAVIRSWYPRLQNLLPTTDFVPPSAVTFRIKKSDQGVGGTSGSTITVSSSWIEKHPEDKGLVVHELVHVVQSYPNGNPWWVTEGIADYIRWPIYEGKPQTWFPRPQTQQGYKKGYRVTAGCCLWLETEKAPGIVKRLNSAMRKQQYDESLFTTPAGQSLNELWREYVALPKEDEA